MFRMIATPRKILCFPGWVLGGKHLATAGMAWCPVSHTGAAQWGVTKGSLTDCVNGGELKN